MMAAMSRSSFRSLLAPTFPWKAVPVISHSRFLHNRVFSWTRRPGMAIWIAIFPASKAPEGGIMTITHSRDRWEPADLQSTCARCTVIFASARRDRNRRTSGHM